MVKNENELVPMVKSGSILNDCTRSGWLSLIIFHFDPIFGKLPFILLGRIVFFRVKRAKVNPFANRSRESYCSVWNVFHLPRWCFQNFSTGERWKDGTPWRASFLPV